MERQNKLAWITGAGGLIGNYLVQTAPKFATQWRLRALTRDRLDLLDFAAVRREFENDKPQLVIHCAAVSTVAGVEADPGFARQLNIEATKLLAELAAEIQFVFFSTDLIFDGRKGDYVETDAPNPLHLYGETKAAAEEIVLKNPRHLVVRTSLNGGVSPTGDRGFNERLKREWHSGRMMKLFTTNFVHRFRRWKRRGRFGIWREKLRGDFSRRRRGKISRWQIGQLLVETLAGNERENRAGVSQGFFRPGARAGHFAGHFQGQKVLSAPLPGLGEWLAANPGEPF